MPDLDNRPFPEAKAPVTLNQLYQLFKEQDRCIEGCLNRIAVLEKAIAGTLVSTKYANLPTIKGVDWDAVKKRFPKLELNMKDCNKYHEQRLRLNGEPSLRQMVEKQQKLERHQGIPYQNLWATFGCTKPEALAWIWFLKKAGLAKEWIEKGSYCKTDLEYTFNSSSAI